MLNFFIGLMIGGFLGVMIMAIFIGGSQNDDDYQQVSGPHKGA